MFNKLLSTSLITSKLLRLDKIFNSVLLNKSDNAFASVVSLKPFQVSQSFIVSTTCVKSVKANNLSPLHLQYIESLVPQINSLFSSFTVTFAGYLFK